MGNLGKYQDIVTAAKNLGGVDNLIKDIEASAVTKAAPKLLLTGAAVGVVGFSLVKTAGRIVRDRYKAREAAANEAKERLRAEFEGDSKSGHGNAEHGVDPSDAGEGSSRD